MLGGVRCAVWRLFHRGCMQRLPVPGPESWQELMHGAGLSTCSVCRLCARQLPCTLRPQALAALCLLLMHKPARLQGRTPSDNLYIRGLPASWTNDDLANLFAAYGGVTVCDWPFLPPIALLINMAV